MGVPWQLSRLSVGLLISAKVMISLFVSASPVWGEGGPCWVGSLLWIPSLLPPHYLPQLKKKLPEEKIEMQTVYISYVYATRVRKAVWCCE